MVTKADKFIDTGNGEVLDIRIVVISVDTFNKSYWRCICSWKCKICNERRSSV